MVRTSLKISVLTLGNKMPAWVNEAVEEFSKRLQRFCSLNFLEQSMAKQDQFASFIPSGAYRIALDIQGRSFDSPHLALHIEQLQQQASHWCFLIGGPEGLPVDILETCHERWSLSNLTLPHMLARIILLETLYRSFTILTHHPYHK